MEKSVLRREIAQMVMPRINGTQLEDPGYRAGIAELIAEGIGGFILFGGDVKGTPRRLRELQALAQIPLLISSDVERGLGQQLAGGTRFPGQRAIASAVNRRSRKDRDLLNAMLDAVREESRSAGIHALFSPVMDVNNNPDNPIICTRAFGEDPDTVEWFGARYIGRLQKPAQSGFLRVLACAKHYPGHGDTDEDSHSVLPVIRAARDRLNRLELPPFRAAVKEGVGMVMVAHLLVPALDPEKPVTFSKKTVTALLREGMEFDGLIVSDALDMGALAGQYTQQEIAVRAVRAGIDILLHPQDARVTIDAVLTAVEDGRLTHERIRESAERILNAKKRLGLFERARTSAERMNHEEHRAIACELGRKALRIIAGDRKLLPLPKTSGVACFVMDDDSAAGTGQPLLDGLMRGFASCTGMILTPGSEFSGEHAADALDASGAAVIAVFSKVSASKGHSGISPVLGNAIRRIISLARSKNKRSVVISFDSPYLLEQFREADVLIAGYDRMDAIQEAAADLLAGRKS